MDAVTSADEEFARWVIRLERIIAAWDEKYGPHATPYSLPLKNSTGLECWREMFDEMMTPQEAFDEDQSNWEE